MGKTTWTIMLLVFLAGCANRGGIVAPVVRVIDGDTIVVRLHGHDERVRLVAVDAYEIRHGSRADRQAKRDGIGVEEVLARGRVQRDEARRKFEGQRVRLKTPDARDYWGRILSDVEIISGPLRHSPAPPSRETPR